MKHWGTILNFVLFAFICLIICIAVWILSGDIQNWMKVVIYAITFAILLPLIHYIRKNKIRYDTSELQQTIPIPADHAIGSDIRIGTDTKRFHRG